MTTNPKRRLPKILALLIAVGAAIGFGTLQLASAASPGTTVTINPSGGSSPTDGLRISYAGGQMQIKRDGNDQLYAVDPPAGGNSYNQIALGVGDSVGGGTLFLPEGLAGGWFRQVVAGSVTKVGWDTSTTENADGFTSVLSGTTGGLTYTVTARYVYTAPDDHFLVTYTVDVPEGNTQEVRLYHVMDSNLGGSDTGPGFYEAAATCPGGGTAGQVVGVDASVQNVVEAIQYVSGADWAGYASGEYWWYVFSWTTGATPVTPYGQGSLADYPNVVNTDPSTDNGYGVNWFFGTAPGSYTSTAKFTFSSDLPDPCDGVPPTTTTTTVAPVGPAEPTFTG